MKLDNTSLLTTPHYTNISNEARPAQTELSRWKTLIAVALLRAFVSFCQQKPINFHSYLLGEEIYTHRKKNTKVFREFVPLSIEAFACFLSYTCILGYCERDKMSPDESIWKLEKLSLCSKVCARPSREREKQHEKAEIDDQHRQRIMRSELENHIRASESLIEVSKRKQEQVLRITNCKAIRESESKWENCLSRWNCALNAFDRPKFDNINSTVKVLTARTSSAFSSRENSKKSQKVINFPKFCITNSQSTYCPNVPWHETRVYRNCRGNPSPEKKILQHEKLV